MNQLEEEKTCIICEEKFYGWGNNPQPVKESGVACDTCNSLFVIPERVKRHFQKENKQQ